jgi:gas vesicle protein
MEAPEVPLEQVQEHIEHHAHGHGEEGGGGFIAGIALSTAILAAFAAVVSLLAGDHANEAMISQMKASDQWAFYQAKGIKAAVLTSKTELLTAQGQKISEKDQAKIEKYAEEQKEIQKEAQDLQDEAKKHLAKHKTLAPAVTMFQIAIAIGAISALTKKKAFWGVSLLFGLAGLGFFAWELFKL